MTTVIKMDHQYLVLTGITRNSLGGIKRAFVTNGAWTLLISGNNASALDSNRIERSRWVFKTLAEVEVDMTSRNYQSCIEKAQEILKDTDNDWEKFKPFSKE